MTSSGDPVEALRASLAAQLRAIRDEEPGTRLGEDPECLHRMRVAVRRARALLRAGRDLAAADTAALAEELDWLGGVLGEVRDLDVLLGHLRREAVALGEPDAAAAGRLLAALERDHERSHASLLDALDGDRYRALLGRFEDALVRLGPAAADASLERLFRRQAKKLRGAAALPPEPSDEELHALRKVGKRLRYAAQLAGEQRVARRAKSLQDVLGSHQDAVVAEERLRALADAAAPAEALAAGRLAERERGRCAEARARWPVVWRRLERTLP